MPELDVITIDRSSVDPYGAQIGGRLEDMGSFHKYVGGSPTNMVCGTARLGLRSGLITRVGDEHMGRFIRETLVKEGVDVRGVITDPERLTALVLLGIHDEHRFPLIFYHENCADMALREEDIDPALIAEKVGSIAKLEEAMTRAHASERSHVIVIDTDPMPTTEAGGHWWDVAVPEVSERGSVREARRRYEARREFQRVD